MSVGYLILKKTRINAKTAGKFLKFWFFRPMKNLSAKSAAQKISKNSCRALRFLWVPRNHALLRPVALQAVAAREEPAGCNGQWASPSIANGQLSMVNSNWLEVYNSQFTIPEFLN